MNVVEMPIAELAAAPYNPRKALKAGDLEYAKLRRSIEEFGLVDPVIWNSRTKRVVGGHQRLTVLRDLGHTTAPTVVVDLDEKREKALNVALNKIAGAWDLTLLCDLLKEMEVSGEDVTLSGFDPKEIERCTRGWHWDRGRAERSPHAGPRRVGPRGPCRTRGGRAHRAQGRGASRARRRRGPPARPPADRRDPRGRPPAAG